MVLPTLQSLLHLVSKYLPYVHDLGLREWNFYERFFYDDDIEGIYIPGSLELMNRADVLATVPAGLWPKVLNHAIAAFRQRVDDDVGVPWTSIYKMVQKLVEVGGIGWSEGYSCDTIPPSELAPGDDFVS